MKRIFCFLLSFFALFLICQDWTATRQTPAVVPKEAAETVAAAPDEQNPGAAAGGQSAEAGPAAEEPTAPEEYAGLYYVNGSTQKFHRADCTYAGRIKEENLSVADDRQELIDRGFSPCSVCTP